MQNQKLYALKAELHGQALSMMNSYTRYELMFQEIPTPATVHKG